MSCIVKECSHENRIFLVIYKSNESRTLFCKSCYEDPDVVNDSVVDSVFNFETGEKLR